MEVVFELEEKEKVIVRQLMTAMVKTKEKYVATIEFIAQRERLQDVEFNAERMAFVTNQEA